MQNSELDEAQAGIKIARRNINNLRYAEDSTLTAESEELLKVKVKEESQKVGLKLNIQKTKIMASGPVTSWQIDGETVAAFSKTSLNIWKFTVHVLLKPGLENFEHYLSSMWDECSCVIRLSIVNFLFLFYSF